MPTSIRARDALKERQWSEAKEMDEQSEKRRAELAKKRRRLDAPVHRTPLGFGAEVASADSM